MASHGFGSALSLVVFSLAALVLQVGCNPQSGPSTTTAQPHAHPVIDYALNNAAATEDLVKRREVAINTAVRVLMMRSEGKHVEESLADRSASLLGGLRAGENSAIGALIANLDLSSVVVGEPGPLEGLVAARSLCQIGGNEVAKELLYSFRKRRTKKEILITAHVLVSCDSVEVTAYRVGLAIDAERAGPIPDTEYLSQLDALRSWLDTPATLRKPENWPCNM